MHVRQRQALADWLFEPGTKQLCDLDLQVEAARNVAAEDSLSPKPFRGTSASVAMGTGMELLSLSSDHAPDENEAVGDGADDA
jgi:hypothetical protein